MGSGASGIIKPAFALVTASKPRCTEACRSQNKEMKTTIMPISALLVASAVISMAFTPPKSIRISPSDKQDSHSFTINERPVDSDKLNELLERLAKVDTNQLIILQFFPANSIEMWYELNERVVGHGFNRIRSVYQGSNIVSEIQFGNSTNGAVEQLLWPGLDSH